ncbi:phosphoadenylyl-sulfate reductase [Candidatus Poribacteria bacterium]|nr:phosphoadenylyl-sulfate reductase [Candidatus Poribacteria bacterium]
MAENCLPEINSRFCYEVRQIDRPQEILFQMFKRFEERAVIITSGQLTGMIITHMAHENGIPFRVCTIDTLRLFPETYTFLEKVEARYGIQIERIKPDLENVDRMVNLHGEFLFFDSKDKQEHCCHTRKVEPLERLLRENIDVWFSGLRRDQSENRRSVPKAQIVERKGRSILKINPLFDWTEKQVRDFIKEHDIPINPLLVSRMNGQFYDSLGCIICTTPMLPGESRRAGRWRWQNVQVEEGNKKECGLHFSI